MQAISRNKINILSEIVSNQIAAGEVVERPVSVVKELIENSLDSGAKQIIIDVQNGGRNIKITDTGSGIPRDEVKLAFARFATSKIKSENDLWNLNTLGFRGEALPSIASVSKLEMITRTYEDIEGTRITINGGVIQNFEPVGTSYGTTIKIEDLFYNTPARLKFLKSDSTEISHIVELVNSFALCWNNVSFSLIVKGKEVLRTNGNNSTLEDNVKIIFGKELSDHLSTIEYKTDYGNIEGIITKPSYSRTDKNKQFVFINNRYVKIIFLPKILEQIYSDLLPSNRHPISVIKLYIPSYEIDVNAHPTKKEVRFHQQSKVYDLIYYGILNALYPPNISNISNVSVEVEEEIYSNPIIKNKFEPVYQKTDKGYQETIDFSTKNNYYTPYKEGTYQSENFTFYDELREYKNIKENNENLENIKPIGRIYETYIIGYLGSDICFIDQHLAHERYIYEQLEINPKNNQELLTPLVINLNTIEWNIYQDNKELFSEYGYEIDILGNNSIIIRSIPSIMELAEAQIIFKQILDEIINDDIKRKNLDKLTEIKKTIACKSAIKAGKHLEMEEINILVKNWSKTKQPYTCPHGRPVIYKLPKDEIDKHFRRTW